MWAEMNRRHFAFGAAIVLQLAILAAIPREQALARVRGKEITLETRPVDPYNVLSGYSVTRSSPWSEASPRGGWCR